jgi:hypothetical protein
MKIGFIGAGTVTGTFGRHLINAGQHHSCVQFQRTGDAGYFTADLGPGASAGTWQHGIGSLTCPISTGRLGMASPEEHAAVGIRL